MLGRNKLEIKKLLKQLIPSTDINVGDQKFTSRISDSFGTKTCLFFPFHSSSTLKLDSACFMCFSSAMYPMLCDKFSPRSQIGQNPASLLISLHERACEVLTDPPSTLWRRILGRQRWCRQGLAPATQCRIKAIRRQVEISFLDVKTTNCLT